MYELQVSINPKNHGLLEPETMFDPQYSDCVFQQYFSNCLQNKFYINCGIGEANLVVLWHSPDENKWHFSTMSKNDVKGYNYSIKVKLLEGVKMNVGLSLL